MTTAIWHTQFSEDLDFPTRTEPTTKYVICSTPRCGSHFLGHLMYSRGIFGYPLEYVNSTNLTIWEQRASVSNSESVIGYIMSRRTSANGCFGIKAHYTQLGRLIRTVGRQELINDYKFILLRRRHVLSQAVSFAFSRQTGSWISGMPEQQSASYDESLIDESLHSICGDNASWERFLSRLALPTLHVLYEDVRADPERELRNIAKFLDVSYDEGAGQKQPLMPRPESSPEKRDWAMTFSRAARARFIAARKPDKEHLLRRIIFKNNARRLNES